MELRLFSEILKEIIALQGKLRILMRQLSPVHVLQNEGAHFVPSECYKVNFMALTAFTHSTIQLNFAA